MRGAIPLFALATYCCACVARPAPLPPPGPAPAAPSLPAPQPLAPAVRVDMTPARALHSFRPARALGAAIDRLPASALDTLYSPSRLGPVQAAGWGVVSYRLNTELHVEAWHWNPNGAWSDPAGRGYFTGAAAAATAKPIHASFGYPLPARGFTHNEGTEEEGYSRLTDGDPATYWKSNPYLSPAFTGESDAAWPQWIVVDLGSVQGVDAIRIAWADPYATRFEVDRFSGDDPLRKPADGRWLPMPGGSVDHARGGITTVRLAPSPVPTRFVRVLMTESSNTCARRDTLGHEDRRSCVGYAIREVSVGTLAADGTLHDLVRHAPRQEQTATDCSSVDPWHEPGDIASEGVQTGLDFFYASGVTRGLPAMLPVAVLYGTPDDAAAEIAYVEKRGYPISYVELGEEADGQYMTPEHYAALYLQFAAAIHAVDPKLPLGGPVFTGQNEDIQAWPDARGDTSWFGRFLRYLQAHGRLSDLGFMSFEHYPFDPCKVTWDGLYDEPRLIRHIMQVWRDDGLPPGVPMLATEVNISSEANEPFLDVFGALWLADYVGAFLGGGGEATYYFHDLPEPISPSCDGTWGGFTMFKVGDDVAVPPQPLSQSFAAHLVTQEWVQPGDAEHVLFPASSEVVDRAGRVVVTAYPVHRPDGAWSILLVNKDRTAAHPVRIVFRGGDGADRSFVGDVDVATFGADQYAWHPDGANGHADPDGPIARTRAPAAAVYSLPRASVTVIRGEVR